MIYSLQVFQEHLEQNNILFRKCEYCQKQFTVKHQSIKKKFCSIQCAGKAKRIDHVCVGCGKIFQNYNDRHNNRVNPKFCNRECYNENIAKVNISNFRYNNFYYCDHCEKWIPQKDSIMVDGWPRCPNRSCGDTHFYNTPNKLKMSSKRSAYNQIRKQVKWID